MNNIKFKRFAIIGLLIVLALSISGCKKEVEEAKEGLVAKVNGEGITEEEFQSDFEIFKTIYQQQYGEDAMSQVDADGITLEDKIKEDILEKLIIEKLIEEEAKEKGIVVTTEEVETELTEYIGMLGGQEQFDGFLESNHLTKEFFFENIRKELLFNRHKEDFIKNATVEDAEIEEYFQENKEYLEKVRARHILLKTEEEGKEALERIKAGENFAKLAEELSFDKGSAALGGDLGFFGKGEMIAEFEEAAFNLNVGETSDLVKTEVGYHIILLEEKHDSYEDLKEDITNILKDKNYYDLLKKIREDAKVKIY